MVPYAIHKGRNTLVRAGREDLLAQMDEYVLPPDNFAQPLTDAWFRHLPLQGLDRAAEGDRARTSTSTSTRNSTGPTGRPSTSCGRLTESRCPCSTSARGMTFSSKGR